jgi:hypothetical protein
MQTTTSFGVQEPKGRAYLASIEPGVQPLCDALNALPGVSTLWSCEGHPDRPSRPYVIFSAPESIAFSLHQKLERGADVDALEFSWWLKAHFDAAGAMQYTIEPNDYRIPGDPWPFRRKWNRKGMDQELKRLANLVAQVAL